MMEPGKETVSEIGCWCMVQSETELCVCVCLSRSGKHLPADYEEGERAAGRHGGLERRKEVRTVLLILN